jgi:hypothetical protein
MRARLFYGYATGLFSSRALEQATDALIPVIYTLHGQRLNFFEGLKVERQQRTECLFGRRLGSR